MTIFCSFKAITDRSTVSVYNSNTKLLFQLYNDLHDSDI